MTDHSEVLQCGDHPIHPTGVTVGVQEMSGKLSAGPGFATLGHIVKVCDTSWCGDALGYVPKL